MAVERQWAACMLRRPAARHVLLKYLRAYHVPAELVQFHDERARLVAYRRMKRATDPAWTAAFRAKSRATSRRNDLRRALRRALSQGTDHVA